ncbi:MAG: dihydrolipoyl dehydrogenase family protein [Fusobacteriaceae bacterium]
MKYDVLVIGGGAAGLTVAIGATSGKKRVAIIENKKTGGECTWSGCVPSKTFISLVNKGYKGDVLEEVDRVRRQIYSHEDNETLKKMGIDVIEGVGEFTDINKVTVNGKEYEGEQIVIATGSSPNIPKIPGLDKVNYLTNESFFEQKNFSKSIIFIGGGVISLELAFPLKKIGVDVTIFEIGETLFPKEDPEIGEYYQEKLKSEGIKLILNAKKFEVLKSEEGVTVKSDKTLEGITAEKLFISTGRVPNTEGLNLEMAGVAYDKKGIEVDKYMRTTNKHIYAAGDVVGPYRFSHMAGYQGEIIVRNILFPLIKKSISYDSIPWTIFTDPEFSKMGISETEAIMNTGEIRVYKMDASENDRSILTGESGFYLKVIVDKNFQILGSSCIGNRSGEIISMLQLMKSENIPFYKISDSIQAYPTYGYTLRKLGKKAYIDNLMKNPMISAFSK